jgi:hypothetical protein
VAAGRETFTAGRPPVVTVAEPFAAISTRSSTPAKPPRRLIVSGKTADAGDAAVDVADGAGDADADVADTAGAADGDAGADVADDDGVASGLLPEHPARPATSSVARTIDVHDFGNGIPSGLGGIGNGNCPQTASIHPCQPQALHSCRAESSGR